MSDGLTDYYRDLEAKKKPSDNEQTSFDVTMDCSKCKEHIRKKVLEEVIEYLNSKFMCISQHSYHVESRFETNVIEGLKQKYEKEQG